MIKKINEKEIIKELFKHRKEIQEVKEKIYNLQSFVLKNLDKLK